VATIRGGIRRRLYSRVGGHEDGAEPKYGVDRTDNIAPFMVCAGSNSCDYVVVGHVKGLRAGGSENGRGLRRQTA